MSSSKTKKELIQERETLKKHMNKPEKPQSKKVEKALRDKEEKLRVLLENVPDFII